MSKDLDPVDNKLPLKGLKVVELHAIGPVPFAGHLLRTLGADIVRVSPPVDPGLGTKSNPEFDILNGGKRKLLVDLKTEAGMAELARELANADVMMEGFRPGVLERLNLAPANLLKKYPKLVVGRLSGFGTHGYLADRAGHDINYLAMCGILHAIGKADSPVPPLNVVGDFGGGAMHLLVGILSRLVQRGISGKGGVVETSILAGSVGLSPMFYGMLAGGTWKLPREANMLDGAAPFYRVYETADKKHVAVGAIEAKFYLELLDVMELKGKVDPATQMTRAVWPQTIATFAKRFAELPRDEWARRAATRDCCLAPVLDYLEAASESHNQAMRLYKNQPFPQTDTTIWFDRGL